jgi:CelD/BcsL family acetyltransferase involved in cellulose biosynthesis
MTDSSINKNVGEMATITEPTCTAPNDIETEVFEDFDKLAALQPEWDAFVEAAGGEIYLTYDWCRIWWKYYGCHRDLKIFLFRCQGDIVGIIPLFFDKAWLGPVWARLGRIIGTDFSLTTVSLPVRRGFIDDVIRRLSEILGEYQWDIINIGPVSGLYSDFEPLQEMCERHFSPLFKVESKASDVQAYLKLPLSWEEYLSSLSKKRQESIRRSYKKIDKLKEIKGVTLVAEFANDDNFGSFFNEFVGMHQSHWQKIGKLGHFGDWPLSLEFHRELAAVQLRRNRLRLIKIRIGDDCLGYSYTYLFGRIYYGFLQARSGMEEYDRLGFGNVIYAKEVELAFADHAEYIDLMQGNCEHKTSMGAKDYAIKNLYIYACSPLVQLRLRLFRILAKLLNTCYYKIWFSRVAPKLRFRRGPLWKICIRTRGLV